MRRRDFLGVLGGAACQPLAARAQSRTMPVIGFLGSRTNESDTALVTAFRNGLGETGYAEGRNVVIDYRWADGRYDQMSALVLDLIHRGVAVIVASGGIPSALAAKAATTTIPIVFQVAVDPVQFGLIASLSRPGGNLTGVSNLNISIWPKRVQLIHELVPAATAIGTLLNPKNPNAEALLGDLQGAAAALGLHMPVAYASEERDFDMAFETLAEQQVGALVVGTDPFFGSRIGQLASLTIHHAMPAMSAQREFAAAGGLMSYGVSRAESHRLAGLYTGRILKGERPADLPVIQPTRFELVINLKTARRIGVSIPRILLGAADELIE
jgi:putative ABC transport system substrate-binding protein